MEINWNTFLAKFGNEVYTKFEDLSRMFFRIAVLKDPQKNLIELSHNPGVEVEPIEVDGKKSKLSSKVFHRKSKL